jgi:hypothetical protein
MTLPELAPSVARERHPLIVAACVLAVHIALISPWPAGVFYDDAMYVVLAKSLATGEGYRYLNIPGAPAATHFPPGYPAVLAALWALAPRFPENLTLLKLANCVFAAVAAAGAYVFARRRLGLRPWVAAATAVVGSVTFPFILLSGVLLSEPLFLALLIPTLYAAERAGEGSGVRRAALVGLAAGALALVRSIGILLVPAACAVLLLRRRPRAALACAAAAIAAVLPWQLWAAAHAQDAPAVLGAMYGPYTAFVGEVWTGDGALRFVVATATRNLEAPARLIRALFAMQFPAPLAGAVLATFLACLLAGIARLVRLAPVTALFLAAYFGVVVIWPFVPDRFIWALWPLLAVVGALGATTLWRAAAGWRWGMAARVALAGGLAAAAAGHARYNARGFAEGWHESAQRTTALGALPLARWVNNYTKPDDVVMTDSELLIYLYTGRRAIPPGRFRATTYLGVDDPAEAARAIEQLAQAFTPGHVLLASATSPHGTGARQLLGGTPPRLVLVDTLEGGGAVLRPVPKP